MAYVEKYISKDVYESKYVRTGDLYVGFVVGYGYVYFETMAFQPPNTNGYSASNTLYGGDSHHTIAYKVIEDRSPEAVRLSLRGLFNNGEAKVTMTKGVTLRHLSDLFGVSVEDIVRWNDIDDMQDLLQLNGRQIIIKSDNKFFSRMGDVVDGVDLTVSVAALYDKPIILGREYIKMNLGGTLVRNHRRIFTSTSKLLNKANKPLFTASVVSEGLAFASDEQSFGETAVNLTIGGIIYKIATKHPITAIVSSVTLIIMDTPHSALPMPAQDPAMPLIDNLRVERVASISYRKKVVVPRRNTATPSHYRENRKEDVATPFFYRKNTVDR